MTASITALHGVDRPMVSWGCFRAPLNLLAEDPLAEITGGSLHAQAHAASSAVMTLLGR